MWLNILIAMVLDFIIGDPPNWPHPVRFIGWVISHMEKWIRKSVKNLKVGGVLLSFCTLVIVLTPILILRMVAHPTFYRLFEIYILYACLASKCLAKEAMHVKRKLETGKIHDARKALSFLVGRDTTDLDEGEVTRGVIETVSENTIDGVLAPLFYMFLGLPFGLAMPFAVVYKTINTLDSMVGYTHVHFKDIGCFSAKLDDVVNYIPARLGSVLMILSGGLMGYDMNQGFKVFFRDRKNHKSPNSGHPESAVAGLLNIQLGGTNSYFGKHMFKPTLGDANTAKAHKHIKDTVNILFVSEAMMFMVFTILFRGGRL